MSSGSFTEEGVSCGLYHLFQLRAKVAGSAYGPGASVLVSARSCTRSKSDGARAVRGPSDPPPKLRLVTDNPETDSIQLRLWDGDNPVSGMQKFDAQRTLPRTSPPTSWPSSAVSIGQKPTRGEFRWEGLACSSSYYFRAQGQGNGVQYSTAWSPWSDVVHGSTWPCAPPTPPKLADIFTDRPTKTSILVRWDLPPPDMRFDKFKVQYRPANNPTGWVGAGSEITAGSKRVGSLTCGNSYYFQVSGKGDGSANGFANSYGPWSDEVQGSTSGCLSPPPAPGNVRASVDLPNAQVTVSWNAVTGARKYKLERGHSDLGVSTTVEWPDPTNTDHRDRIITDMFETNNGIVSRTINLAGLSLPCGPDVLYSFRVSAYGNGTNHLAAYGPPREATFGALTSSSSKSTSDATTKAPSKVNPLCTPAPEVDVIPLLRRRAQLRWDPVPNAVGYTIQVRAVNGDWPTSTPGSASPNEIKIGNE